MKNPNYTQIPNDVLDRMFDFTHPEFKVLMLICRQTFGWQRKKHLLSFSFIEKGTGLARETVNNSIFSLCEKKFLNRESSGNSFRYWLNVDEFENPDASSSVELPTIGSPSELVMINNSSPSEPTPVRLANTKKERKETEVKEKVFGLESGGDDSKKESEEIPKELNTPDFLKHWEMWKKDRKDRKAPITAQAKKLQLKKLRGLGPVGAIACINEAIESGWKTFFPKKLAQNFRQPEKPATTQFKGF